MSSTLFRFVSLRPLLLAASSRGLSAHMPPASSAISFHAVRNFRTSPPASEKPEEQPKEQPKEEQPKEENPKEEQKKEEAPSPAKALADEIASLKTQRDELRQKLQYSLAERENIRQMKDRELANLRKYGVRDFAKEMLEVSDNLARALESVPADSLEKNPQLKALHEGVTMTHAGLTKIFEKNSITEIDPLNQKFDPERHQALFTAPDPSKENNTVMSTIKTGFIFHDKVLRAAQVGVVKNPDSSPPPPATEEKATEGSEEEKKSS